VCKFNLHLFQHLQKLWFIKWLISASENVSRETLSADVCSVTDAVDLSVRDKNTGNNNTNVILHCSVFTTQMTNTALKFLKLEFLSWDHIKSSCSCSWPRCLKFFVSEQWSLHLRIKRHNLLTVFCYYRRKLNLLAMRRLETWVFCLLIVNFKSVVE